MTPTPSRSADPQLPPVGLALIEFQGTQHSASSTGGYAV